jgi:hypothetical protein
VDFPLGTLVSWPTDLGVPEVLGAGWRCKVYTRMHWLGSSLGGGVVGWFWKGSGRKVGTLMAERVREGQSGFFLLT